MANSLILAFQTTDGKICNLRVNNPKPGLSRAEVESVMNDIISKNVFETASGASLSAISSVYTVTTAKSELLI